MHWNDWMKTLFANLRPPNHRKAKRNERGYGLHIDILEERTVPTASLRLAAMGDSLTASYAGFPGRSEELSWTQQIEQQRPGRIDIFNEAVAGATSGDVLFGGQADAVRDLVAAREVDYVTLIVGANDLETELNTHLPILLGGDPALFYQTFVQSFTTNVTRNIQDTLDFVSSARDVGFVLGNIPDVTITPAYAGTNSFILFAIHDAVISANDQIEAIAAARQIPMIDLYELSHLTQSPFSIGRVTITNLYAADGFHPNTVAQGVLANTILKALDTTYDAPLKRFVLSDQQILADAGIAYPHGKPTYFDVSPFVIFESSDEPIRRCPFGGRGARPHHSTLASGNRQIEHARHKDQGEADEWRLSRTVTIGKTFASIARR